LMKCRVPGLDEMFPPPEAKTLPKGYRSESDVACNVAGPGSDSQGVHGGGGGATQPAGM